MFMEVEDVELLDFGMTDEAETLRAIGEVEYGCKTLGAFIQSAVSEERPV